MIVPGCLNAGALAAGNGHLSLSIVTPLNGSTIGNDGTALAISGSAQTTSGTVTAIQYQIDGGAWSSFTFTAAPAVSYAGGNAGEIGVGSHTVTVKATDSAGNTATVSSSYTIAVGTVAPSYSWTPQANYNGQNNYLTIRNAAPNANVAYAFTSYDAYGNVLYANSSGSTMPLGMTDANGNFSYTGTAAWGASAWTGTAQLYVNGNNVANFSFSNLGTSTSYSYSPYVTANGLITLSIANAWASSTVAQTITYSPSGRTVGPTAIGSTSATGNFSGNTALSWGSDTSASISVTLNGRVIGNYNFIP